MTQARFASIESEIKCLHCLPHVNYELPNMLLIQLFLLLDSILRLCISDGFSHTKDSYAAFILSNSKTCLSRTGFMALASTIFTSSLNCALDPAAIARTVHMWPWTAWMLGHSVGLNPSRIPINVITPLSFTLLRLWSRCHVEWLSEGWYICHNKQMQLWHVTFATAGSCLRRFQGHYRLLRHSQWIASPFGPSPDLLCNW